MAFTPRTYTEIINDMISYVQAYTTISDFTVGSVVRTILEAAALEDDEQYFQMVQLLDLFSITTAAGEDLDRRLADFNLVRQPAKSAFGGVRFKNFNLVSDQIALDASAGGNLIRLFDSTGFPTSGFPYTVRIGEGSTRVQDVSVIAVDTVSNELTLDGTTLLVSNVEVGDRVTVVTGAQAHVINSGTEIQSPPTNSSAAKIYKTQEPAFIAAGNFLSNEVIAKASEAGKRGNASTGRVVQFVGSPPFAGSGVENTAELSGGRNRETDQEFRSRALEKLQSLSKGTPLALRVGSVGVTDPVTTQRVVSSNLLEEFVNDEVIVYIDDGTGLTPDTEQLPQSSLSSGVSIGDSTLTLSDGSDFPSSGFVLISDSELVEYESKSTTNSLKLSAALSKAHSSGDIVRFIDYVSEASEAGQRRFSIQNFPVVRSTDRIWTRESGAPSWTELVRDSDFRLNKGTGDLLIIDTAGLAEDTEVVAFYSYYTNLIAEVQKVLEGDLDNTIDYPGVKAAGIFLSVEAPSIRRVSVRGSITAEASFVESDLAPLVRREIENYISSLKIGQDVIRSRIIDAAHNVSGVKSIVVTNPSSDIVVLENQLPVPFDTNNDSLVTVV